MASSSDMSPVVGDSIAIPAQFPANAEPSSARASESAQAGPSTSTATAENGTCDASSSQDATIKEKATETIVPIRDKESFQKYQLERVIHRDKIATAALMDAQRYLEQSTKRRLAEIADFRSIHQDYAQWFPPSKLYGRGYDGFGNGHTDSPGPPRIIYPKEKPRPGKRTTPALPKPSRKDMKEQAEQYEELVPIRLDVDWDKIKVRDTLTWNLNDRLTPIDLFSAQLVEDLGLKAPSDRPVFDQVQQQIREQLNDFYPMLSPTQEALDPELPYSAYKNDEMRILIKLNIIIGSVTLVDQFEWDINDPLNSPEEFARVMARDLSLSGEFTTAIAHCIREQSQLFTRSLYVIGHPFDGRPVEEPDLVSAFLPSPLPTVFRPQQQAKDYAPYLYELSDADLDRNEVVFAREQRKQKRAVNRRGGPQLPDLKERQRTIRTLVVSSTLPGAATSIEETGLYKRVGGVPGGRGRRGAGGHDGGFSDSDESEDSAPDSPALSQLPGTARTRTIRGAATAAQQRMAHLGRSETPEVITSHHHETRISSRRIGREVQETPDEPRNYWVRIRIPKSFERARHMLWSMKTGKPLPSGSQTPVQARAMSASAPPGSMGPPSTPSVGRPSLTKIPSTSSAVMPQPPQPQLGRLPAPPPPAPGQPSPPLVSRSLDVS